MAIGNKYLALSNALKSIGGTARDTGAAVEEMQTKKRKQLNLNRLGEMIRTGSKPEDVASFAASSGADPNLANQTYAQILASKQANISREDTQVEKKAATAEKNDLAAFDKEVAGMQLEDMEAQFADIKPKDETETMLLNAAKRSVASAKKGGDYKVAIKEANDKIAEITNYRIQLKAQARLENKDAKSAYGERTFALKPNQIDNLNGFDVAETQINTIKNLFKPEMVGPVAGRIGKLKEKVGVLGEDETAFRTAQQEFKNVLIKLRSGAAVTESEAKRLEAEMGSPNIKPEQFQATVNRALQSLKNQKSIYINSLKKSKFDVGEWGTETEPVSLEGGLNKEPGVKPSAPGTFDDTKKRRLEELRAKKAAGTLGK